MRSRYTFFFNSFNARLISLFLTSTFMTPSDYTSDIVLSCAYSIPETNHDKYLNGACRISQYQFRGQSAKHPIECRITTIRFDDPASAVEFFNRVAYQSGRVVES